MSVISQADLRWARTARPGDYLHRWRRNRAGYLLKGTGGRRDEEISAIQAELRKRGMILESDDLGLVVAW